MKSKTPPVVELDVNHQAAYIRFRQAAVSRTIVRDSASMHLAVDLDRAGEVVGIEAIGFTEFSLSKVLEKASVRPPAGVDLAKTRFRPVACHA